MQAKEICFKAILHYVIDKQKNKEMHQRDKSTKEGKRMGLVQLGETIALAVAKPYCMHAMMFYIHSQESMLNGDQQNEITQ